MEIVTCNFNSNGYCLAIEAEWEYATSWKHDYNFMEKIARESIYSG